MLSPNTSSFHRRHRKAQYLRALSDKNNLAAELTFFEIVRDRNKQPVDFGDAHSVFHLTREGSSGIALKLYCQADALMAARYEAIAGLMLALPYEVRKYLLLPTVFARCIRIFKNWHPGFIMPWQDKALALDKFILSHKPDFDYTLLSKFRRMMQVLRQTGMAHGCLEPGNVLVQPDLSLVLIDYDNMFAAGLPSLRSVDAKLPPIQYRHPTSSVQGYGPWTDNFAAWLIDTLLLIWSADGPLFQTLIDRSGRLTFDCQDMLASEKSPLLQALLNHQEYEFSQRGRVLWRAMELEPQDIWPLSSDGMPPIRLA